MKFYKEVLAVLLLLGLTMFLGCDNSTESSDPATVTTVTDQAGGSSSDDDNSSSSDSGSQSGDASSDDDNSSSSDSGSQSGDASSDDSSSDIIILPTVYTVEFNPNGGTGTMADLTADKADSVTLPANAFVKTGYTFTHWNDASSDSGNEYADKAAIPQITADITLFAQWTPKHYIICLSSDGDVKGDLTLDAVYDSVLPSLSALPSKIGYDFRGYFSKPDGRGTKFIDTDGTATETKWTVDEVNSILYAFFVEHSSHTIEYRNTKDATNPNKTTFKETDTVVLSDIAVVGYTFIGWFDASTDGSLITGWNAGDKDDNVTLWARWAPNIICFNDGTYGSAAAAGKTPVGIAIATDSDGIPLKVMNLKQSDSSMLLWAINDAEGFYKEFNTSLDDGFGNWDVICKEVTDEDIPGRYPAFEYANSLGGSWYIPAKNELNAIYQCKDEINTALRLLKDAGFDADLIDDVERTSSWYHSSSTDGTSKRWLQIFANGEQIASGRYEGRVRTVRHYNSYKVTFVANGGIGEMDYIEANVNEEEVLPNCTFTRGEYHSFVGWNDKADGTGNAYADGQSVLGIGADGEAVTLYAQWRHHAYTVIFDANDGTNNTTNQTICVDETTTLTFCTFTREYHTFIGWNDKQDGSGNEFTDENEVFAWGDDGAIITLYAQWRHDTYQVTFNANGGNGLIADQTYYVDETVNLPACTFFNTGYTFIGWNDKADGTGNIYNDGELVTKLGEDGEIVQLYAQWKPNHYVITLSNIGDVSGDLTLDAEYNSRLPDLTLIPSKEGYFFAGYFSEPNGKGTQYIDEHGNATVNIWTSVNNLTLYAFMNLKAVIGRTICYSDGTYTTEILSGKTPVGIVIETDEMCKPTKMMHFRESYGEWCSHESDLGIESGRSFNGEAGGYYLPGNYSDGQDNWLNIQIAIPDGDVPGYYPIFQWADSLSEYGGGWYIPAVRELYSIYKHKFEINETLNTMQSNYPNLSIDLLKTEYGYWTSCGTYGRLGNMASIYIDFRAADTGPERIGNSLEYNGEGEQTTLIQWWRMDAFYCRAVRHF